MKRIFKGVWAVIVELLWLPVSILLWVCAVLYTAWDDKLDVEAWRRDLALMKKSILEQFSQRHRWINS